VRPCAPAPAPAPAPNTSGPHARAKRSSQPSPPCQTPPSLKRRCGRPCRARALAKPRVSPLWACARAARAAAACRTNHAAHAHRQWDPCSPQFSSQPWQTLCTQRRAFIVHVCVHTTCRPLHMPSQAGSAITVRCTKGLGVLQVPRDMTMQALLLTIVGVVALIMSVASAADAELSMAAGITPHGRRLLGSCPWYKYQVCCPGFCTRCAGYSASGCYGQYQMQCTRCSCVSIFIASAC
jgi:hypothetical protein